MSNTRLSVEETFIKLMQTASGSDLASQCYYDWDVLEAWRRFESSEEWAEAKQIIRQLSPPLPIVLDLGAGNGIGSYALARMGFRVAAVEPDSSTLVGYGASTSVVQTTLLPIQHVSAFGEYLPFKSSSFGLVYSRQMLHHARDIDRLVSEVARVLVHGGAFVACREHVVDDEQGLASFLDAHPLHRYTGGEGAFRLDQYLKAIELSGMETVTFLGPWDSVINHYPTTTDELDQQIRTAARKRFGRLGALLATMAVWKRRYKHTRSARDRRPGRLYSFVALKRAAPTTTTTVRSRRESYP